MQFHSGRRFCSASAPALFAPHPRHQQLPRHRRGLTISRPISAGKLTRTLPPRIAPLGGPACQATPDTRPFRPFRWFLNRARSPRRRAETWCTAAPRAHNVGAESGAGREAAGMQQLSKKLMSWASILEDGTREQAERTAAMPFISRHLALMPDAHLGRGATVGSVIPTIRAIIPAAVGVDIGCGMIAVRTQLTAEDA